MEHLICPRSPPGSPSCKRLGFLPSRRPPSLCDIATTSGLHRLHARPTKRQSSCAVTLSVTATHGLLACPASSCVCEDSCPTAVSLSLSLSRATVMRPTLAANHLRPVPLVMCPMAGCSARYGLARRDRVDEIQARDRRVMLD